MTSFDSQRPDFAPYGFTCVRWQPSRMLRPDRHNEIEINLLPQGQLTYLLAGRRVEVPPRRLCAFWAALPHQIIAYEGTFEYFVATLPLAWFLQGRAPKRLVYALLQGQIVFEADEAFATRDMHLLSTWEADFKRPQSEVQQAIQLELEARLLRLALSCKDPVAQQARRGARPPSHSELSKAEQMAALIARRYMESLTVEDLGRSVQLHPNYAMSLFKRTFGTTLVDYLTKYRVSHAQRLLVTTLAKVADVARDSGFASVSRFNAVFRELCGCSPRDYRHMHRLR